MRTVCKLKPTAILFKPVFRENSHDFVLVLSILNDNEIIRSDHDLDVCLKNGFVE